MRVVPRPSFFVVVSPLIVPFFFFFFFFSIALSTAVDPPLFPTLRTTTTRCRYSAPPSAPPSGASSRPSSLAPSEISSAASATPQTTSGLLGAASMALAEAWPEASPSDGGAATSAAAGGAVGAPTSALMSAPASARRGAADDSADEAHYVDMVDVRAAVGASPGPGRVLAGRILLSAESWRSDGSPADHSPAAAGGPAGGRAAAAAAGPTAGPAGGAAVEETAATVIAAPRFPRIEWRELRLLDCVATGFFGAVHRGVYRHSEVAVKMLELDSVSDSEVAREAAMAERVARHACVLRFFGACLDGVKGVLLISIHEVFLLLLLFLFTHYSFLVYSCCVDGVKAHRCLVSEWLPRGSLERCYRFTPSELFVRSDGAAARVLASAPAAGAGAAAAARYASGTTAAAIARGTASTPCWLPRVERVVPLLLDAASGLLHLHAEGVIHRDVACRNMLLASGGRGERLRLKICDFGLSKSGRGSGYYVAASGGGGVGACRWMAPESLRADPDSGRVVFSTAR